MRPILDGPVHTTTNTTQRKRSLGVIASQLFECRYHAIWIETAIRKIRLNVGAKLQLSTLQRDGRINARLIQSLQVTLTLIAIHDVNRLVATLEPIFYEGEQDPILFLITVEEGTNVSVCVELGTGKGNGSGRSVHGKSPQDLDATALWGIRMHHLRRKCPIHTFVLIDTFVQ
jgi:hypothetical protein